MAELTREIKQVQELADRFASHFAQYSRPAYNETEVRVEFVNPFFQVLGWDVLNERGLPQHLREVKHETNIVVEEEGQGRKKRPDYSFRNGTEICFFLETKKPAVDILSAQEPAFQVRRYGWSGNHLVSVLTNFTDMVIYDCSVRPVENDPVATARVVHYHYTEYAAKFEEIHGLISREAVSSGTFANCFSSLQTPLKKDPFDDYFLRQIQAWRKDIGQSIVRYRYKWQHRMRWKA